MVSAISQNLLENNGPCFYPALHIYFFSFIYTIGGIETYPKYCQLIMMLLHIFIVILAVKIYASSFGQKSWYTWSITIWLLNTKLMSNQVRSWYAESLNILWVYLAIFCMQKSYNFMGVIWIAIGMAFKMNVLLFIPAVYYITSKSEGIICGTFYMIFILSIQILVAYPFMIDYAEEYLTTTFKFDRKFSVNSSINYNWILFSPFFHSTYFTTPLLVFHVGLLLYFLFVKWLPMCDMNNQFSFISIFKKLKLWPLKCWPNFEPENAYHIAEVFFTWNFIGVACSRTIHQQFLIWYWFSIPFLMYEPLKQGRTTVRRLVISILLLNYWFTYSSTPLTSLTVFIIHIWYIKHITFSKRTGVSIEPIDSNSFPETEFYKC